MNASTRRTLFMTGAIALGVAYIVMGISGGIAGDDAEAWGVITGLAGGAYLIGLWACRRLPLLGGNLVVFAAAAMLLMTWWMIFTFVLVPLAAWFGVAEAHRTATERRAAS